MEREFANANWQQIEADVVERIRALAIIAKADLGTPAEYQSAIDRDLISPNLRLLFEFVACVEINDEPGDTVQ